VKARVDDDERRSKIDIGGCHRSRGTQKEGDGATKEDLLIKAHKSNEVMQQPLRKKGSINVTRKKEILNPDHQ